MVNRSAMSTGPPPSGNPQPRPDLRDDRVSGQLNDAAQFASAVCDAMPESRHNRLDAIVRPAVLGPAPVHDTDGHHAYRILGLPCSSWACRPAAGLDLPLRDHPGDRKAGDGGHWGSSLAGRDALSRSLADATRQQSCVLIEIATPPVSSARRLTGRGASERRCGYFLT